MIARSPDGDVTAEFRRKVGHLLSPMTRRSFQEQTIFWGPEALPTVARRRNRGAWQHWRSGSAVARSRGRPGAPRR